MADVLVKIGDSTNSNHGIQVQVDGGTREARFNSTRAKWEFSDNGTAYSDMGSGGVFSDINSSSLNSYQVDFVNLDEPDQVWNNASFLQACKNTSWYAELGAPPVHGIIYTDGDRDAVVWYDRVNESEYMRFTCSSNNMIEGSQVNDVGFKDGIIYVCHDTLGLYVIDLLRDNRYVISDTDIQFYKGDISDRNGGNGEDTYANTSLNLADADAAYISGIVRDPEAIDEFGRPKHWWLIQHDADASLYNPTDDAVYTDDQVEESHLNQNFQMILNDRDYTTNIFLIMDARVIDGDGWKATYGTNLNFSSNVRTDFYSNVKIYPYGNAINPQWPILLGASSPAAQGTTIYHLDLDDPSKSGTTKLGGGIVPENYAKGASNGSVVRLALDSGSWWHNDTSPQSSETMTENGDVTHSAGILGNCSVFDGSSYWSEVQGDSEMHSTNAWTVACWVKSGAATNPSNKEYLWAYWDSTNTHCCRLYFDTNGYLVTEMTDDAFVTQDQAATTIDYYNAAWHFVVVRNDTTNLQIWVDGVQQATVAISEATSGATVDYWYVGANNGSGGNYTGSMDQYSMSKNAWVDSEIAYAYTKGLHEAGRDGLSNGSQYFLASRSSEAYGELFNELTGEFYVNASNDTHRVNPNGVVITKVDNEGSGGQGLTGYWPLGASESHLVSGGTAYIDIWQGSISGFHRRNNPILSTPRHIYGPTQYYGDHSLMGFDAIVSTEYGTHKTIQAALDAGAKHIKVRPGTYSVPTSITQSDVTLEGSGRATILSNATNTGSAALTVAGDRNMVKHCAVRTAGGGDGGDQHAILVSGDQNTIQFCFILDADDDAIRSTGDENRFLFNTVEDADGHGIGASTGLRNMVLGNHIAAVGNNGIVADGTSDNIMIVGNHVENTANAIQLLAGADDSLVTHNVVNVAVTDSSTGSTEADNEVY